MYSWFAVHLAKEQDTKNSENPQMVRNRNRSAALVAMVSGFTAEPRWVRSEAGVTLVGRVRKVLNRNFIYILVSTCVRGHYRERLFELVTLSGRSVAEYEEVYQQHDSAEEEFFAIHD